VNVFVVFRQNAVDPAGDFGGNGREVSRDISVIGFLMNAVTHEETIGAPGQSGQNHDGTAGEKKRLSINHV
jgi:hypothetical protein